MPDEDKKGYTWCVFIGCAIVGICFLFSVFGSSGKERTELQDDTDRTMGTINVQHQLVRSQLDFGAGHIDGAGDALQRAHELINQSQRRIEYGKARIKECQDIIAESRRSLEEAKRIIQSVEASNSERTQGSTQERKGSLP